MCAGLRHLLASPAAGARVPPEEGAVWGAVDAGTDEGSSAVLYTELA